MARKLFASEPAGSRLPLVNQSQTTLRKLFPGNLGRLTLSTVVLRLKRPELMKIPMDAPITDELAQELMYELQCMRDQK
jgi:hypothetical protein